jgi:hypothetical protein
MELTKADHRQSRSPGDNPEILARKLLREKFGKHHAFYKPIIRDALLFPSCVQAGFSFGALLR